MLAVLAGAHCVLHGWLCSHETGAAQGGGGLSPRGTGVAAGGWRVRLWCGPMQAFSEKRCGFLKWRQLR